MVCLVTSLPPGSTVAQSSIEKKDWIKMVSNFISTNINEACIDIPQIEAKLIDISIQNQPQVRIL